MTLWHPKLEIRTEKGTPHLCGKVPITWRTLPRLQVFLASLSARLRGAPRRQRPLAALINARLCIIPWQPPTKTPCTTAHTYFPKPALGAHPLLPLRVPRDALRSRLPVLLWLEANPHVKCNKLPRILSRLRANASPPTTDAPQTTACPTDDIKSWTTLSPDRWKLNLSRGKTQ